VVGSQRNRFDREAEKTIAVPVMQTGAATKLCGSTLPIAVSCGSEAKEYGAASPGTFGPVAEP
jgi:hypothetical protein